MPTRRALLVGFGSGLLVSPLRALAQRARRIGFLSFGSRQSILQTGRHQAFHRGMRELGYAVDKDFVLEERYADGNSDTLRAHAAELVASKVDVIVTTGTPAIQEARRATTTIPIVVAVTGADPVASGHAESLARPGRNVTGLYVSQAELIPKWLELLTTVVPKMTRVAIMQNPANGGHAPQLKTARAVADKARMQIVVLTARTSAEIESAFSGTAQQRVDGLLVLGDAFFTQQVKQIATLALKHRLPSIYVTRDYALAGGLMSYGEDIAENYRLAAEYVDRIFKGAKAGDLPFRRSPQLDLTINRRSFEALGISVPRELALQAREV